MIRWVKSGPLTNLTVEPTGTFATVGAKAHGMSLISVSADAESAGMSSARLSAIDRAVTASIERKETPGAVVVVGRRGQVVYRKAFGDRAILPKREPMTLDTIFDLASLTKVISTATSIMILVERGQVSLADPVALYIPEFGRFGKERVTVEQLLTHRAGFVPDNEIADYVGVTIKPLEMIYELRPSYERQYRQTIRRVDLWTVLKLSICFYLTALVVLLFAGVCLWWIASAVGIRCSDWKGRSAPRSKMLPRSTWKPSARCPAKTRRPPAMLCTDCPASRG